MCKYRALFCIYSLGSLSLREHLGAMSNVLLTSHKKRSILHRLLSLSFVVCRPMGPPLVQVPCPLPPTFFVDDVVELSSLLPLSLTLCIHYARETGNNNSINAA